MPLVRFASELPRAPERRFQIYRLRQPTISRRTFSELGSRFGLTASLDAGRFVETSSTVAYVQGTRSLTIYRASGGWRYRDIARWQIDDRNANLDITDADAIAQANAHLAKLHLTSARERQPLRVARLHVASSQPRGEEHEERIIDVAVAFRRVVDRRAVEGPGGMTVIYMDHEGQLTGVDHLWREIEAEHRTVSGVRTAKSVQSEVERRYGGTAAGRVEVTRVELAHFEMGFPHRQRYLQPAYVVFVRLVSEDERINTPSVFAIPAAENAVGRLEPPPPKIAEQPSRSR